MTTSFASGSAIITMPTVTSTLVGTVATQTLTNKTLTTPTITSPTIASPNLQNILTDNASTPIGIAAGTGVVNTITNLVRTTTTQTLANKSFEDQIVIVPSAPNAGTTGSLVLADGGAAGTTTTVTAAQGSNVALTLPSATGTIALLSDIPSAADFVDLASVQTITGQKSFGVARVSDLVTLSVNQTTGNTGNLVAARNSTTGSFLYRPDIVSLADTQTLTNKTINSATNTVQVNGTNINSLVNQDVRTTASPGFAATNLGGVTGSGLINLEESTTGATANRKIVFFQGVANEHQFIGLGLNTSALRFQVNNSSTDFIYYTGTSTTTSAEVFRVLGAGGVRLPTAGGTATAFNYYEQGTFTATYSGAGAGTATWRFTRSGTEVTIFLPLTTLTFAAAATLTVAGVPARLLPTAAATNEGLIVYSNGAVLLNSGKVTIPTAGNLTMYANFLNANFTGPGVVGHDSCNIRYCIN
jgi:hypothetical protein